MEHELPDEDQMRFYLEDQEHHTQNLMQNRREAERVIRDFDIPYSSRDEKLAHLAALADQREKSVYELGRLSVHIERLEEVMRQKERLRLEDDQNRETMAVMENHLDWLEIEVRPQPAPSDTGEFQER
ncbi:hypothetical protein AGR1A_Cc40209 [Agrobacterium fabacearum CFBP 5771]|uniref:hypothetical protein n=1 Tax=Agrobacterium tumefaciens TaxID=358 RepID=UPI0009B9B66B|nr:hypothetical protein [Agrobacterium tumefaciens]CVI17405.1 hypothetical protein AGR1A_Cc40209 [Agrobacterium fabacearum CFBP 5771]